MDIDAAEFRRVADELAIRDLVARYADAVCRNDERAWSATWADDGCWAIGGNISRGREEALETFRGLMALFEVIVQLPHSGVIELDGDRASGRWTVTERGRAGGDHRTYVVGCYEDEYERRDRRWKFSKRTFSVLLTA